MREDNEGRTGSDGATPETESAANRESIVLPGAGGPIGGPVAGEVLDVLNQPIAEPSSPPAQEDA